MLLAYCHINEKRVVPAAEKLVAKMLRQEIFRNFCVKRILLMTRRATAIQRFYRKWILVFRARIFVLHKFLKKIQGETQVQYDLLKTAAGEAKKKRRQKQGEDTETQFKLTGQLLDILNRFDTDP